MSHPSPQSSLQPSPWWRLVRLGPAWVGFWAAVVTVVIWTGFIVVARASADPGRSPTLTPLDILLARIVASGLVLLPVGWWMARRNIGNAGRGALKGAFGGLSPLPWGLTVQCGVFGGVLYGLLAYHGFVFAPAAHASVLLPGSLPLWTAGCALLMLGQRITPTRALGLLCIVGGDLLVGGASLLHALDGSGIWRGDVLFMGGSVCWAIYSVLVRKHAIPAVQATVAITVFAVAVYVPAYALLVAAGVLHSKLGSAPLQDILRQMLMQGLLSVVVAGVCFNVMIRHYGPVRSTMLTALVPGLSAVSAALLLDEPLPAHVLLGLGLVTVGIVFGVRQAKTS